MEKSTFLSTLVEKSFQKSSCRVVTYGTELGQGPGLRGEQRPSCRVISKADKGRGRSIVLSVGCHNELLRAAWQHGVPILLLLIQIDYDAETLPALIISDLV